VTPQHQKQIQIAADEIGGKPQRIEIRGHTARRPVPVASEGDKWDLAYRRCRNTMQRLVALGIDPRRIRLGVAADNEPLVDGDEPLPRSRSSRVEIFMLDEVVEGSALEPRKAEDSKAAQN
jgi:chemotaxis protein MotB